MKTIHVRWNRYHLGDLICFPPLPRNGPTWSGLAADYMFEQMGEQKSRRGSTEHGDKFSLVRKSGDRFALSLWLYKEAEIPFEMRSADPYQTDISDILALVQAGGAS